MSASARDDILDRVRTAITGVTAVEPARDYQPAGAAAPDVDMFVERVRDYRATVQRCRPQQLRTTLTATLEQNGASSVVVPPGLDGIASLVSLPLTTDDGTLTPRDLDTPGTAVITSCAVAIATTGTLILDGSDGQGRRLLTLVPDIHVCIVPEDRIVANVPDALASLEATRPQTWISGPSATSDIELHRVEGVHGPRRLAVIVVGLD